MRRSLFVFVSALLFPLILFAKPPVVQTSAAYVLVNRANLLDLAVLGGVSNDSGRVIQGPVTGAQSDIWKFEAAGDSWRITSAGASTLALDVSGGRLSVRSSVGSAGQLWSIEESDRGFARIRNIAANCYLSAPVADNISAPLLCAPTAEAASRAQWSLVIFDADKAQSLYALLLEGIRKNIRDSKEKERSEQTKRILVETTIRQVLNLHEQSDYIRALDASRRLVDEFPGIKDYYFNEAAATSAFYIASRELGAGRYPSARSFFQLADKFRKTDRNLSEDARFRNLGHLVRLAERRAAMGEIKPEFTNRLLVLCIARAESESSRKTGRDFPGVDYRTSRLDLEALQALQGAMRTMVEVYTAGKMSLEFQNHYVEGVLRDTRPSGVNELAADLNELDPPVTDVLYEQIDRSDSVWILWNASGPVGSPAGVARTYPLIPYSGFTLPVRGYLEGGTKNRNLSYFMYAWLQTILARAGSAPADDPARAYPEAANLSSEDLFEYLLSKQMPKLLENRSWGKDSTGWRRFSYREEFRLNIPRESWVRISKRIKDVPVDARKESLTLWQQGEQAVKSGDTKTADLCFTRALERNPTLSAAHKYQAQKAEASGDWSRAATRYADLFEISGDWDAARRAGEIFLFRLKAEKEGDHYLQTAIDLAWKAADRTSIRDKWTGYYLDKGDLEKAARIRGKDIKDRPPISEAGKGSGGISLSSPVDVPRAGSIPSP